jgi:glycosyltransferase involved in cell wall biosynthesis
MPASFRKKLLFISHDSSLTGAPILLLNLLKLIKKHSLYDFEILLYRGGSLEDDFKKLGPTDILKDKNYATTRNNIKRGLNFLKYQQKLWKWQKKVKKFDLVFNNTVTNGKVLEGFAKVGLPIVSYVHELESVIRQYYANAILTFQFSGLIAVPSSVVGRNLELRHSVPEHKIKRLDYFFSSEEVIHQSIKKEEGRRMFFDRFKLPINKFYVVSMGTATHRKGIDLFLEVCKELQADPDMFFVWIGDFVDESTKEKTLKDIEVHNLSHNFLMTGFLPNSSLNLLPFDLFCLTSREDPYPLVVIEAAMQKIPSLCFDSGGISDFVSGDCGWLINDFSPSAMAEKIRELKKDKKQMQTVGENAGKKALELHTNEERILIQFKTIINQLLV